MSKTLTLLGLFNRTSLLYIGVGRFYMLCQLWVFIGNWECRRQCSSLFSEATLISPWPPNLTTEAVLLVCTITMP